MKYLNLWFLLIILFGVFAHSDLCSPSWLNNVTGKEVKDLIEHGHDVDQICNNYNDRPIHLALMLAQNNLGVILSLVNANADLFAENKAGQTPFQLAQDNYYFANNEMEQARRQRQSDVITLQAYNQTQRQYGQALSIWRRIEREAQRR